jgi:hypothetical protein
MRTSLVVGKRLSIKRLGWLWVQALAAGRPGGVSLDG